MSSAGANNMNEANMNQSVSKSVGLRAKLMRQLQSQMANRARRNAQTQLKRQKTEMEKNRELLSEEFECPMCKQSMLDTPEQIVSLPCRHSFCCDCVVEMQQWSLGVEREELLGDLELQYPSLVYHFQLAPIKCPTCRKTCGSIYSSRIKCQPMPVLARKMHETLFAAKNGKDDGARASANDAKSQEGKAAVVSHEPKPRSATIRRITWTTTTITYTRTVCVTDQGDMVRSANATRQVLLRPTPSQKTRSHARTSIAATRPRVAMILSGTDWAAAINAFGVHYRGVVDLFGEARTC